MITSTLELNEKEPPCSDFPVLYERYDGEVVVLFSSETAGVVVSEKNSILSVGFYYNDWTPCTDPSYWQRIPNGSTVTLTQCSRVEE